MRDRKQFEDAYPRLKIETMSFLPWLAYLLSGGVTKRNLIPNFLGPPIRGMESLLSPLAPVFSLHWHIRVRKSAESTVPAK